MVYCSKCGTLNSDDANVCSKCGSPLRANPEQNSPYWRHRQYREEYREYYRGHAGMGALFFGIIILAIGLILFLSVSMDVPVGPYIWPTILILVGLWVLFIGLRRSGHRYRQLPPQ